MDCRKCCHFSNVLLRLFSNQKLWQYINIPGPNVTDHTIKIISTLVGILYFSSNYNSRVEDCNFYKSLEPTDLGRQCLVRGDGETSLIRNGGRLIEENPLIPQRSESARLYRQIGKDIKNEKSKKLQETVDTVALYLFPCIFVVFNCIYWPYYMIIIDWTYS